jgi:xylulose-5-phosphate/fructose-6-phosphate phosphoketolase
MKKRQATPTRTNRAAQSKTERTATAEPNSEATLVPNLLRKIDAYWRAANYLSVGQIYLYDTSANKRSSGLVVEALVPRACG